MQNPPPDDYQQARYDYEHTVTIIQHLTDWKEQLHHTLTTCPKDTASHGLISEIDLAISRLQLLAGTDIYDATPPLSRLQPMPDDYDYRLMCELGYKNRDHWQDAQQDGHPISVKAGDYIIHTRNSPAHYDNS